jgi:hypothetical protein
VPDVICPNCQKRLLVTDEFFSHACACPACGSIFQPEEVWDRGQDAAFTPPVAASPEERRNHEAIPDISWAAWEEKELRTRVRRPVALQYDEPSELLQLARAWLPAGPIGFVVGSVLALIVASTQRLPAPRGEFFAIPAFGCLYGLIAGAIVQTYRKTPATKRWLVHGFVGITIVLYGLCLWLLFREGKEIRFSELLGVTIGSLIMTGILVGWLALLSMVLNGLSRWEGPFGPVVYDPLDDPDENKS